MSCHETPDMIIVNLLKRRYLEKLNVESKLHLHHEILNIHHVRVNLHYVRIYLYYILRQL